MKEERAVYLQCIFKYSLNHKIKKVKRFHILRQENNLTFMKDIHTERFAQVF